MIDTCVIGAWEWDATNDRARADAFVAALFNVDPQAAEASLPVNAYMRAIHPDDQERVTALIDGSRAGGSYSAEYRVRSVGGMWHRVRDQGRFYSDAAGRPQRGYGIVVDITDLQPCSNPTPAPGTQSRDELLDMAADHAIKAYQIIRRISDPVLESAGREFLLKIGQGIGQLMKERA